MGCRRSTGKRLSLEIIGLGYLVIVVVRNRILGVDILFGGFQYFGFLGLARGVSIFGILFIYDCFRQVLKFG